MFIARRKRSEEANLVTAQLARHICHVPQVVMRLYDPHQAEIYWLLGVQAISLLDWSVQRVADLLLHSQLNTVHSTGNGEVEIVEVAVPPQWIGHTSKDITMPGELNSRRHYPAKSGANPDLRSGFGTV